MPRADGRAWFDFTPEESARFSAAAERADFEEPDTSNPDVVEKWRSQPWWYDTTFSCSPARCAVIANNGVIIEPDEREVESIEGEIG